MKTFVIIDGSTYPVDLNELNQKVCEFWDVTPSKGFYASPKHTDTHIGSSWVSVIGNAIANNTGHMCWDGVIESLVAKSIGKCVIDKDNAFKLFLDARTISEMKNLIEFYKPYVELIQYFAAINLQPRAIEYIK